MNSSALTVADYSTLLFYNLFYFLKSPIVSIWLLIFLYYKQYW